MLDERYSECYVNHNFDTCAVYIPKFFCAAPLRSRGRSACAHVVVVVVVSVYRVVCDRHSCTHSKGIYTKYNRIHYEVHINISTELCFSSQSMECVCVLSVLGFLCEVVQSKKTHHQCGADTRTHSATQPLLTIKSKHLAHAPAPKVTCTRNTGCLSLCTVCCSPCKCVFIYTPRVYYVL